MTNESLTVDLDQASPEDPLKKEIKRALREAGPMVVDSDSQLQEVLELRVSCSKTQFKRALGSLIHGREVVRHRPLPETRDAYEEDRIITFRSAMQ